VIEVLFLLEDNLSSNRDQTILRKYLSRLLPEKCLKLKQSLKNENFLNKSEQQKQVRKPQRKAELRQESAQRSLQFIEV